MAVLNVRDLLIDRVGVPVTTRRDTTTAGVLGTGNEFLKGNPIRVGFQVINAGGFVVWVAPLRVTAEGFGFRLEANGGALFTNWEEDGEVVALPWFALAIGGSSALLHYEQVIDAAAQRSAPEGE